MALAPQNMEQLKRLLSTSNCVQVQAARDCVSSAEFLSCCLISAHSASDDKSAALGACIQMILVDPMLLREKDEPRC